MGQTVTCSSCCSDARPEVEFRTSIFSTVKQEAAQDSVEPEIVTKQVKGRTQTEVEHATVKLQTVWKGVLVRRLVKRLARHLVQNHDFFSRDEVLATLSNSRKLASAHEIMPPYRYASGAIYTGQWLGGFRDGWGTIEYSSGAKYEGYWSFSRPNGEGKFSYPNGQNYKGKWRNPLSQGKFSLCKTGEGWRESVRDGYEWLWYQEEVPRVPALDEQKRVVKEDIKKTEKRIISICQSIQRFDTFKLGSGRDLVQIEDTDYTYTGEALGDAKDGFGKQVWKNGDFYEGQWKENMQYGWGRNVWTDGSVYIGTFKRDNKDGVGEYTWEDGTRFLGNWKDNMMHGCGKYTWPDCRMYEGEWRAGLMQGYGVYTYSDGKRYEGGWFQGKKHGVGLTVLPDGRTSEAVWKGGKVDSVVKG
jgi:hypothetical protein